MEEKRLGGIDLRFQQAFGKGEWVLVSGIPKRPSKTSGFLFYIGSCRRKFANLH